MRPGGLRLGAEDFANPAAGGSYLFERLLGWGVAVSVRLRATGVRLELGAPPPSEEGRELFFVRGRSRSMTASSPSSPRAPRPPRPERGPGPARRGPERLDRGSSRTEIHKARPSGVAYLSFLLLPTGVEVALVVPTRARAEREHLARLLLDKPAIVTEALEALPLPFVVGPEAPAPGGPRGVPVQDVTADQLRDLLRAGETLWIGWTVRADAAVAHATTLGGELEAAMLALGELFRQIAWLSRNAPSAPARLARRVESAEPAGASDDRAAPLTADDRLALLRGARAAARPDARVSLRLRSSAGGRAARAGAHAAGTAASPSVPPVRRRSGPPAAPGAAGAAPHSAASFDRGAEVEVLSGPFAGRIGVVQEIDGKGDARVLFGLLATRIAAKNLALSARDGGGGRPSLASSHRKGREPRS